MKANKSIILAVLLLSVSVAGNAQDATQAYNFSENMYIGSARTLAMGNAFTAVGGDMGALSLNPAASGVFRMSEFELTPAVIYSIGGAEYLSTYNKTNYSKFGVPNFGFSQHVSTGRTSGFVSFNFGLSYNRVKSFNSIVDASGLMNAGRGNKSSSWLGDKTVELLNYNSNHWGDYSADIPWASQLAWNAYLVDEVGDEGILLASTENYDPLTNTPYLGGDISQSLFRKTLGSVNEIALNFAGNWNDNFYFGVNVNIYDVNYRVEDTYSERAMNSLNFESGFEQFRYNYRQTTVGTGIAMKFGMIYLPTQHLRIGATISTPTKYVLTDYWDESISCSFDNGNKNNEQTPGGRYDYQVKSPMRYSLGLAYTIGVVGLVSVDYEGVNYSKVTMRDSRGNTNVFSGENAYIRNNYMRNASIVRVGAEVNATPGIAIRGGYSYYQDGRPNYDGNHFASCGLGFRLSKGAYLDLAWQGQIGNEQGFTLYNDYEEFKAPVGYVTNTNNKVLATLRFKF